MKERKTSATSSIKDNCNNGNSILAAVAATTAITTLVLNFNSINLNRLRDD